MQARRDGQPATLTISFLGHSWSIFRRGSCPVQSAFPRSGMIIYLIHLHSGQWLHDTLHVSDKPKALGKLGNIVAETFVILDVSSNVSMFAHPWKH